MSHNDAPAGAAVPVSPVVAPRHDPPSVAMPLAPGARVLLVGAHPDDETIGAGRLAAMHDGPVRSVTLSGGERCVVDERLDPSDVLARRLEEWRSASGRLGVDPLETPRWPDGELTAHEAEIVAMLVGLLGGQPGDGEDAGVGAGADVVLTLWRHDPHPDHQAAGRASATAAEMLGLPLVEYPVWAAYWTGAEQVRELGYEICATACTQDADAAREDALAAYTSQTEALLPGTDPVVPAAMLARHDRQLLAVPRA